MDFKSGIFIIVQKWSPIKSKVFFFCNSDPNHYQSLQKIWYFATKFLLKRISLIFVIKPKLLSDKGKQTFPGIACCLPGSVRLRRGIYDSFFLSLSFSCSQVIIKKSSNDKWQKKKVWINRSSFLTKKKYVVVIWWLFNDNLRARGKKEPQSPCPWLLKI